LKSDAPIATKHIFRRDLPSRAIYALVSIWLEQPDLRFIDPDPQITVRGDIDFAGVLELEIDIRGAGVGGDGKVVLDLTPIAIVSKVDARIDPTVLYTGIMRNVGSPFRRILPNQVIAVSGLGIEGANAGIAVASEEPHGC
jgi:hypothetical protein